MLELVRRTVLTMGIQAWLTFSAHSWTRHVTPQDSPQVHAPGVNPDRVLLAGDGAATGRGVLTHDLGLPGHLARQLSVRTSRATDVDLLADDSMTAGACLELLLARDLAGYNVIVLSVGASAALHLASPAEWQLSIRSLIDGVRLKAPHALIFVLAVPQMGANPHLPTLFGHAIDYRAGVLNTIIEHTLEGRPNMVFVPEGRDHILVENVTADHYRTWADGIAEQIFTHLDPNRPQPADTSRELEEGRLDAVHHLEELLVDNKPVLDDLTVKARTVFRTDIAAITLLREDTELFSSVSGADVNKSDRRTALCDITIRRDAPFVIEDTSRDPRYASHPAVSGDHHVRFYAGYPLHSPDGYRIGAVCIMDSHPRHFTSSDTSTLRTLAATIQRRLYTPTAA
jgi:GAF domain-containing protein